MPFTSEKLNYLHIKEAERIFLGTAWAAPTTVYIGLITTAPSNGNGTGMVEVTTANTFYARVPVPCSDAYWSAANTGTDECTIHNLQDIVFNVPKSDGTNWGDVIGAGIFDALSGGNCLYYSNFAATKTIVNTDGAPKFAIGSIRIKRAVLGAELSIQSFLLKDPFILVGNLAL